MPYLSVALNLAATSQTLRRLRPAASLAKTSGARLHGVSAIDPLDLTLTASGLEGLLLDSRCRISARKPESLHDHFLAATKPLCPGWRAASTPPVAFGAEAGQAAGDGQPGEASVSPTAGPRSS